MCSAHLEPSLDELMEVDPRTMTASERSEWILAADTARSRLEARFLDVVGEWDANGDWGLDGARSAAGWLAWRCDMHRGTARRAVIDARKLRDHPATAAACHTHGTTKVRTMVRFVNERTEAEYEANEQLLLDQAKNLSVDQTGSVMRFWALHADPDGADPADPTDNRLHITESFNGRYKIDGDVDAVLGATLHKALSPIADRLWKAYAKSGEAHHSRARLMAEALGILLGQASKAEANGGMPAQPSVTVIVDYPIIVDLLNNQGRTPPPFPTAAPISPDEAGTGTTVLGNSHINGRSPIRGETIRRLACDAGINRIVTNGRSIILDAGRTVRTVTPSQRKAMLARSPTCEFAGCDIPAEWCSAHHIKWWGRDQGETNIHDLAWECSCHHVLMHEGAWTMERQADGTIAVYRPDGTRYEPGVYDS